MASGSDTEAANKKLARKMWSSVSSGDDEAFLAMVADDAIMHHMDMPEDVNGKDGVRKLIGTYREGFPSFTLTPEDVIAAGDWVTARVTFKGKNTGDLTAMNVKATGKDVTLQSFNATRFENGKMKEHYVFLNGLAFAAQLGLMDGGKMGQNQ